MAKRTRNELKALLAAMTREEKASLCAGDGYWNTDALPKLGVEPMTMTDGPHGVRKERGGGSIMMETGEPATCFPTAASLACGFDTALAEEIGTALGREATAHGVQMLLGPGVNIKRSPLCGRNFEYFSEDPVAAGELGAAMIRGIQRTGVGACVKHFCCNNQEDGRFVADSVVDRRALHEIYLEPFRRAVEKGSPRALMSSYNKVNGEYAGENEYLMKTVLRGSFGFDGLVVSDWGAVNDRVKGIRAGLDLEMPGKTSGNTREILSAVERGDLAEADLDRCALRVLALADESVGCEKDATPADLAAHNELARRAAAACAVLMKNDGGLLPLAPKARFAVVGGFAETARSQGTGSSRIQPAETHEALAALDAAGANYLYAQGCRPDGSTDETLLLGAERAAREMGTAVVFCGLPGICESEGYDRAHMDLPDGMRKLIARVRRTGARVAVVLMLGAPVALPFADGVDSILCLYTAGQCAGAAAVDLLLGAAQPSGKLAETWPLSLDDVPCRRYLGSARRCEYREGMFVGYRYYEAAGVPVRYKFGHGLHYTSFETCGAALDRDSLTDGGTLRVSWRVRNTGARPGAETVFVFAGRHGEAYRQLRAFAKVRLGPGEEAALSAALTARDFAYFNTATGGWEIENGDYDVWVGPSLDALTALPLSVLVENPVAAPAYYDATEAASLPDETFYRILGRRPAPETPGKPYTLNSTLRELRGTGVGRLLGRAYESGVVKGAKGADASTVAMLRRSAEDMPLRALCDLSKGMLPRGVAEAILRIANGNWRRGKRYVAQKK